MEAKRFEKLLQKRIESGDYLEDWEGISFIPDGSLMNWQFILEETGNNGFIGVLGALVAFRKNVLTYCEKTKVGVCYAQRYFYHVEDVFTHLLGQKIEKDLTKKQIAELAFYGFRENSAVKKEKKRCRLGVSHMSGKQETKQFWLGVHCDCLSVWMKRQKNANDWKITSKISKTKKLEELTRRIDCPLVYLLVDIAKLETATFGTSFLTGELIKECEKNLKALIEKTDLEVRKNVLERLLKSKKKFA